jgi:hypothetical protein
MIHCDGDDVFAKDPSLDARLTKLRYAHEHREYQQLVKNMPGNRSI